MADVLLQEPMVHAPAYDISVGGKSLSPEALNRVVQVIYNDTIDGLDSVELVIDNWDNDTGTFRYQDAADFDPAKPVDVKMGYFDTMTRMISADIVTLELRMRQAGQILLHVRALNRLHRLRTEQRTKVYERKTDSQIASEIAGRIGMSLVGDQGARSEEVAHPYLLQANQYDIVFLLERARRIGYDLWLETPQEGPETLHFRPSARVSPSPITLEWEISLLEATVTLSTAPQTSEVELRAWDPMRKKTIVERATWSHLEVRGSPEGVIREAVTRALSGRREIVVDQPVQSAMEAKVLARRSLESQAKELAVVQATAIGTPAVHAGSKVTLDGLGKRYSGTYFVTRSMHRADGAGYRTSFTGRLEHR